MAEAPRDTQGILLEAGLALASELSLDAVLQRIVELATQISGARYGALGVLGPGGDIVEFVTTGITEQERAAIGPLPVGHGILGVLIHEAKPLRLARIAGHPRSVGFPKNHPPMRSFLGAPVTSRGKVFGNIYLTEKQSAEEFTEEDERALVVLATQAGVAIENARLYEEANLRERRLHAIQEVTTAILSGAEPAEVLSLVASRARELVHADLATVATPVGDGVELQTQVADGLHADQLLGMTFPRDGSVSGEVVRSGRTVRLDNASEDGRVREPVVAAGDIGPAVVAPLASEGQELGTLSVANRIGSRPFDEDAVTVIQVFAAQASVALEYARVRDELRRFAVLADRERIAKELHDGAIQALFAVGMGLQGVAALSRDEEASRRIEAAVTDIDRVIRDLRNYIFGLRPGILADRQLDQALRQLAEEFEERSGVTTVADLDSRVAAELSSRASDVVQMAREALSNVGRHASATTCRLSLFHRDGYAGLEIDDDGEGFDADQVPARGQGLLNLRERAESLGGELEVESTPGEGTTVRILVPLH